jgi:uncharacterized membrane protein
VVALLKKRLPRGYTCLALPRRNPRSQGLGSTGVLPNFLQSFARDVNDGGAIVGYCTNPPLLGNGRKAFIWRNGVMTALQDVLDSASPQYPVWYAYGINNAGQIAATVKPPTGSERAALLTPVPANPGDTNCDWFVNIDDLLNVINGWGPYPPSPPKSGVTFPEAGPGSADLNADGVVNIDDLLIVLNAWAS